MTEKPKRGLFARIISTLFLLILLAGLAAGGIGYWHYDHFTRAPIGGKETKVLIQPGESLAGVVMGLRDAGVTAGNDLEWQLLAARLGVRSKMKVGEYAVKPDMTPDQLLLDIATGKVIQYHFTIVEGWNMRELRAALKNAPAMQHLLMMTSDNALMQQLGRSRVPAEGRFLPETYAYTRDSTDLDLLARAARAMDKALGEAWEHRDPSLTLKTPDEALILASIVEKETAVPDEREKIAGVFVRRLQTGMKLETDPTVIYGLGGSYNGNITRHDLIVDTPYNTYTRMGLPPTPIAMPGRASLQAATHPESGDALYFVASGTGGHVFSATLAEHNAAVARYVKLQRDKKQEQQ
ncbi:MAG TPA: endolytic transglycosylase MltG [Xanthomonadaceae bacterium]|nr:endolytic transglycosylase MltG [Xanthomonadaceae bacterium]